MQPTLNDLGKAAQEGNQEALEDVIRQVQGTVYKLAIRMLKSPVNIARRDGHHAAVSFDDLSLRLQASRAAYEATPEETHEDTTLTEEVKRSCTLGMLLCLDVEDRLALVLGEVFGQMKARPSWA